ncbi:MAG: DsrH/TusB family sulfur metabolism protein [Nitrospirota bacterium]
MDTLHIIREPDEKTVLEIIEGEARNKKISILLVQDGVFADLDIPVNIYVNSEDIEARGIDTGYKEVDYEGIRKLIINHKRVIVW